MLFDPPSWTVEQLDYLRDARRRGVATAVMAAHLHKTPNAVLGMAFRKKYPSPHTFSDKNKPKGCTILAAAQGQCRWPLWGAAFPGVKDAYVCAAASGSAPYCAAHSQKATRPPPPPMRRRAAPE